MYRLVPTPRARSASTRPMGTVPMVRSLRSLIRCLVFLFAVCAATIPTAGAEPGSQILQVRPLGCQP